MRTGARAIVVGLALVLTACGGSSSTGASSSNSYQGKTIQLGAILSLTGAGGVYGPSSQKGMQLAVDKINNSGGVNGAKISLDVKDDASDKIQSAQVAQTLIQQGQLLALLGHILLRPPTVGDELGPALQEPATQRGASSRGRRPFLGYRNPGSIGASPTARDAASASPPRQGDL